MAALVNTTNLIIDTPRWSVPLLEKSRYKGAKGGRSGGKSWLFADNIIDRMIQDPETDVVCIREIQKSIKYSVKKLIAKRIADYKLSHLFDIQNDCIYRIENGKRMGIIIFVGMQDHTADSIKSLEGFDIAWIEEAQNLSANSIKLLTPTIRKPGSELWFGWNPSLPTDAVDVLFKGMEGEVDAEGNPTAILVHVNYLDNPYLTKAQKAEAERYRRTNPMDYPNVWLGMYKTRTDDQIFGGKYVVDKREIDHKTWKGPYHGLDWGFSKDPLAAVKVWITSENELYIEKECGKVGLDIDDTPQYLIKKIEGIEKYTVRADNALPSNVSYCRRYGIPKCVSVDKWPNSIKDGVEHLKSYEKIVVHPDCKQVIFEMNNYKYKTDKVSGDVMPDIIDKNNHYVDAIRYAISPIIRGKGAKSDFSSMFG
jgi:phage terminase large subunit